MENNTLENNNFLTGSFFDPLYNIFIHFSFFLFENILILTNLFYIHIFFRSCCSLFIFCRYKIISMEILKQSRIQYERLRDYFQHFQTAIQLYIPIYICLTRPIHLYIVEILDLYNSNDSQDLKSKINFKRAHET